MALANRIAESDRFTLRMVKWAVNSAQDAISNAVAIGKPGVHIATLAQDYAFGRDGVAAFKEALAGSRARLMIGHVNLTAIDPDRPASHSKAVIDGLIRKKWKSVARSALRFIRRWRGLPRNLVWRFARTRGRKPDITTVRITSAWRAWACPRFRLAKG